MKKSAMLLGALFWACGLGASERAAAQTSASPVASVSVSAAPSLGALPNVRPSPAAPVSSPTPPAEHTTDSAPSTAPPATSSAAPNGAAAPDTTAAPVMRGRVAIPADRVAPVGVPRFAARPVIDGRLDEEVWRNALVLRNFFQVQPGENVAPSQPTEALVGYDATHLYIAFRAYDDPRQVRATVPRRDNIWEDDYVGVWLDTFNDQQRAYALFFNPLGVQADGIFTEGRGEDYSVDIVMESKGVVGEDGYTVEIAIPFRSLRYEAGRDRIWRAHFFRRVKRNNNELISWMPLSREESGNMRQAGQLTGLEDITTTRTLEIIPSLTLSQTGRRARAFTRAQTLADPTLRDPGRFVNDSLDFDPGLTIKFGITPTMTLDFALNPDFAQVEADQTVVTANQRFPIFFSEKRPFFLEGIEIFRTPLTAVHTRAIVDPDYAAKFTGRRGRNSLGIIFASDNAPGNFSEDERNDPSLRPSIERFLDRNATIGILRYRRDFGSESNVGLIATTYNFVERHNHLAGFDGRIRLNPQTTVSFQALGTNSRRFFYDPDLDRRLYRTGNGFGYRWDYDFTRRRYGFYLSGEGFTRDYRSDVGFTPRTNTNRQVFFGRYSSEPNPQATLISWRISSDVVLQYDWQGRSQRWDIQPQASFNLPRQTFLLVGYRRGYERLFEEEFGPRRTATRQGAFFGADPERSTYKNSIIAVVESTPLPQVSLFTQVVRDFNVFDFDFGAGPRFPRVSPAALADPRAPLDPGAGNHWNIGAGIRYRPIPAFNASLDYTKSRLVRHDTERVAFDDNIYSLRATYQFTRFIFARARIDYTTLAARARGQFLLGWTPNPGTALYVGYNDDLSRNGFSPFTGELEPGFRRNGRTFFIKMSYLFQRSFSF